MKNLCISLMLFISSGLAFSQSKPALDVPYVPTRPKVVNAMLELAGVREGDVLLDLGCGDGRIVIAAAKSYGATGTGIDINPKRIEESNENAKLAGVMDKVKFMTADLFETDLTQATVITMFLLPRVNLLLRPKLMALKPGTRIVSHAHDLGDWKPDKKVKVGFSTLYLWTVPVSPEAR